MPRNSSTRPLSWSEEVCSHCKGYPQYPECTCTPEVVAKREQRREATAATTVEKCGWTSPSGIFVCIRPKGHTGNHGTIRKSG